MARTTTAWGTVSLAQAGGGLSAILLGVFLGACPVAGSGAENATWLTGDCPPAFVQSPDGRCRHASPYLTASLSRSGLVRQLIPDKETLDPKAVALGRLLFFDPLLSRDRKVSCATCHHPAFGMSDGRGRSMGRGGEGVGPDRRAGALVTRSAPALWNLTFKRALTWDGRRVTLEEQARTPLGHPDEMNLEPAGLVARLNDNAVYRQLYAEVFGDGAAPTYERTLTALADFERSLVALDSRYDRYALGGPPLTPAEMRGFNIFRSFVSRCAECHTPPLYTNDQMAVLGAPDDPDDPAHQDPGAGKGAANPLEHGSFRVADLRNVARTAPYMHAGAFKTLREVVKFYSTGAGRGPLGRHYPGIHWHMRPMGLGEEELDDVVAFLGTLTDLSGVPAIPARLPSGLTP